MATRPVRSKLEPLASERPPLEPVLPDHALVHRIRAGDKAAFEALYAAYHTPLTLFVRGYLQSADAAEEVVQDVLCRVWELRATWDPAASVRSYLYGAARNRALNELRHCRIIERTARRVSADIGDPPASANAEPTSPPGMGSYSSSADEHLRTRELAAAIVRAVDTLPKRCRLAFTLRRWHHLTPVETAQVMGISIKGVELQFTKALKMLRTALADYL